MISHLKNRISCFDWKTGRPASAGPMFPLGNRGRLFVWIDFSPGPICVLTCGKPVLSKGLLTLLTRTLPLLFWLYFVYLFSSFGIPLTSEPSCWPQIPAIRIWVLAVSGSSFSTTPSGLANLWQGWFGQSPSSFGGTPQSYSMVLGEDWAQALPCYKISLLCSRCR